MLVSCPTCPAQYDVADSDVGPEGRVVECSACGARWLQPSPGAAEAAPAAQSSIPGMEDARRALAEMKDPGGSDLDADDLAAAPPEGGLRRETLYGHDDEDEDEGDAPSAPVRMRKTDPAPAASPAEPTPLRRGGLDLGPKRAIDDDAPDGPRGARRMAPDLPDASRLNAELRASAHDEERVDRRRRSGFRTGLWLVLLVGGAGAGLYYGKAEIEARLPQAAPYLDRYVTAVDDAQVMIMGLADQAMARIMPLISGDAPQTAPDPAAPAPQTAAPPAPPALAPAGQTQGQSPGQTQGQSPSQPPAMQSPAAPTSPASDTPPASTQGSLSPSAPRIAAPASAVMTAPGSAPSAAPSLPAMAPAAMPAAPAMPRG